MNVWNVICMENSFHTNDLDKFTTIRQNVRTRDTDVLTLILNLKKNIYVQFFIDISIIKLFKILFLITF